MAITSPFYRQKHPVLPTSAVKIISLIPQQFQASEKGSFFVSMPLQFQPPAAIFLVPKPAASPILFTVKFTSFSNNTKPGCHRHYNRHSQYLH